MIILNQYCAKWSVRVFLYACLILAWGYLLISLGIVGRWLIAPISELVPVNLLFWDTVENVWARVAAAELLHLSFKHLWNFLIDYAKCLALAGVASDCFYSLLVGCFGFTQVATLSFTKVITLQSFWWVVFSLMLYLQNTQRESFANCCLTWDIIYSMRALLRLAWSSVKGRI